jgi:Ca2+-binding EF-hand superfamily protein
LPKELRVALNAIGKRYSEEDVARVVASIDTDGNGKVCYLNVFFFRNVLKSILKSFFRFFSY